MTTMRNYRQISKTDASGVALGGSSCRAVRDRIKFRLNIVRLTLHDVLASIPDGAAFGYYPAAARFNVSDQLTLADMANISQHENSPEFTVQDMVTFTVNDEINVQEE